MARLHGCTLAGMSKRPATPEEPQTVPSRVTGPPGPMGPAASYALMVAEGPDRGLSFEVDASQPCRILVGSSVVCPLRLTDPEVSRRHVALELEGARLRIGDLGSTNGTFVDNVRVIEALLGGGENVRLGATVLRVEKSSPRAAPELPARTSFGRVIGASLQMRRLYGLCERLAASDIPVVIEGETGTGKEALAEALHEEGPRQQRPFIVFDCTAVPPNLVESELFGHERGAFTGAVSRRVGLLEQAQGGTLLIDEIGDLDLSLQPKLLRAVERGEIRPVGANRTVKLDVRLLAATRRDLDVEVQRGRFRDDLFHRLAVARVELPPLRRRRRDISLLARHFCAQFGGEPDSVAPDVYRRWEEAPWPGNVRELRNAVARHLALGDWAAPAGEEEGDAGESGARPESLLESVLSLRLPLVQARQRVVDEFERVYLERVLADHGGNVRRAAVSAGVGRRYFQRLRARNR
jgi:two-component system, NtrC family, response regulator HydG